MKHVLLLFVLLLSAVSVARADTLIFTLSGVTNGSFKLDSNPTPDNFSDNNFTGFNNLTFTDGATTVNNYDIIFFSTSNLGSFSDISAPNLFDAGFFGAQVYSGPESAPVFAPGTFFASQTQDGPLVEKLVISVAPEPAGLVFMLTGFASTGFVAVRRRWALRA